MSVILAGAYVTLTDGATVATDASLGEFFVLSGFRASRTMSNPTNPTTGQSLTYRIDNSGGALATSWGSAFVLAGPWTDPSPDRSRSISFFFDGSLWLESGRTGANLQLAADPGDIVSLVAWWDSNLLTLSDADPVSTWEARFGPTLVALSGAEPTFKTAIQNSRPIVRFDGTDNFLSCANPLRNQTDCSIFAVFAKGDTTSTDFRGLVDIGGNGVQGGVFFENTTSTANRSEWSYGTGAATGTAIATTVGTAFHQWSVTHPSGGTPKLYKDAGSAINGSGAASTSFVQTVMYVGSNTDHLRFMYGDLAELILYSTSLNDTDRAAVATYLKNKWGTP